MFVLVGGYVLNLNDIVYATQKDDRVKVTLAVGANPATIYIPGTLEDFYQEIEPVEEERLPTIEEEFRTPQQWVSYAR